MATINKIMFLGMVDALATDYQCTVTCLHRTPARNAAVGGNPQSRHLVGMGADLVPDDWANAPAIIKRARAYGLDAIHERDHIHIEADRRTD
jgi:hypothetical protein